MRTIVPPCFARVDKGEASPRSSLSSSLITASSSIAAINGSGRRILLYLFLFCRLHPQHRRLTIQLFLSVDPPLNRGNREGQSALSFVVVSLLRCDGRQRRTTLLLLPLLSRGLSSPSLLSGSLSMKHAGRRRKRIVTLHRPSSAGCGKGTASCRPRPRQQRPHHDLLQ